MYVVCHLHRNGHIQHDLPYNASGSFDDGISIRVVMNIMTGVAAKYVDQQLLLISQTHIALPLSS